MERRVEEVELSFSHPSELHFQRHRTGIWIKTNISSSHHPDLVHTGSAVVDLVSRESSMPPAESNDYLAGKTMNQQPSTQGLGVSVV
jgi:hypothetical protein